MSESTGESRGAAGGARRARAAVWIGHFGWLTALAVGVWLLRGSLPAGALMVSGIVVLAVGAAGVAAPLIRRRTTGRHGGRVAVGWVLCGVAGLVLFGAGVVLLVAG
ncbi:hypothetical protein ABZ816_34560 [Actinosynnema sp. NPDC047251]|uniref:hypothetical protein n=1 Tax=Saccharothrix espanaensis TaxID=103731 RepID=UPI00130D9773|nr:hypothetical protein [Saccharothrix espanaensis]